MDYLNDGTENSLGIDAVWISPIYKSPMKDFGYDISDYGDIDAIFGSMDDFKLLLQEAHKRK
ncbi:MAG: alpha-amylase family glycosyl hydrolase [Bacillota bacterium]